MGTGVTPGGSHIRQGTPINMLFWLLFNGGHLCYKKLIYYYIYKKNKNKNLKTKRDLGFTAMFLLFIPLYINVDFNSKFFKKKFNLVLKLLFYIIELFLIQIESNCIFFKRRVVLKDKRLKWKVYFSTPSF
jgi:hypothetical protein